MRILFISHTGALSGAENALLSLFDGLGGEHDVAVARPPGGPLQEALDVRGVQQFDSSGTDVSFSLSPVRTPVGLVGMLRSAVALRGAARRFGADVVHANSVRAGLIAVAARRLGGPPVVVQCHDHLPDNRTGRLTRGVIARGAEEVVAVTDATASHFNLGLPSAKANTVYISLDHARFSPAARHSPVIRDELGLPAGARVLAHVAQITPWKGQATSIRTLQRVRERYDTHLLIVGDVAFSSQRYDNVGYRQRLEDLAHELGVRGAVHFLGNRTDVPEVMGGSDALVLPSDDEPFGLVVAEAMAVGLPVLVTQNGGIGEYVTDGVNGRLLPPDDVEAWASAVINLFASPSVAASIGKQNVRAVARFTDARYADGMLDAYARATGHGLRAQ